MIMLAKISDPKAIVIIDKVKNIQHSLERDSSYATKCKSPLKRGEETF